MMLHNNFYLYSLKLLTETLRDIVFFPIWWYSRGLIQTVKSLIQFMSNREKGLAFFVWVKNFFKPMYGQSDWQGRLISMGMRLMMIIFRGLILIFWLIISIGVFIIWLILPILVVFELIFQFYA
ncbi:MAG: hypothetical protein U9Q85_01790 [Patescibacteria group bacterium]|nr:hypothetical protein [Patescibacteria group bacterium]